ncbi:DUF3881 family protein [Acetatifactor muris]|uniref:DUF based on E. rectale Gene description n=2 Tax=Acetatifactor muris TaxID=879566 RepID=A0A2K4ZLN1_9FIRM|nr:DUF3881 family protein [Lachnospiraceae bacterium]MCR2049630.1 DUF3881 family protein [Acetatifactor muris]SOY31397.1 DUF based on E. rectale Gene description [Acetatifactor muris]
MHKYMRAIGFSTMESRKKLQELLTDAVIHADRRSLARNQKNILVGEFCKDFAKGLGVAVCGELDEEDGFIYEYYYPYLDGTGITSYEDVSVERHADKESYAGVCDDIKVGISLIFYLKDKIPYIRAEATNRLPVRGTTLTLSALSTGGTILFPIQKDAEQEQRVKKNSVARNNLMAAARKGDEDAIETLTLEDMDMYTIISKRIQKEDVFSLVDTYFMPYGVECDQYSILGEIMAIRLVTNEVTGEKIYILTICCNELTFDVSVNIIDVYGEPQVGRRFKGVIWLQGSINFPEEFA